VRARAQRQSSHRGCAHARTDSGKHFHGADLRRTGTGGGMNAYCCYTLIVKEVRRFWKVIGQTVGAPVITSLLYLLVFHQVLEGRVNVFEGVSYTAFLIPGLMMMSIIQNSFANTSSSLTQSKIQGNLVFLL